MGLDLRMRWWTLAILLGFYLTLRGYQSFDGDQAYRLPLLLQRQDPGLYQDDPFVQAFDSFNPHRGYLDLLDGTSRVFGLSASLFLLFVATFALSFTGLERLARVSWPDSGSWVGILAFILILVARAGNIGTNHLFASTLLDRQIGFALGWVALAAFVVNPSRASGLAAACLGLAAWVHPSVGLQLALLLGGTWLGLGLLERASGVSLRGALMAVALLALGLAPAFYLQVGQADALFRGMAPEDFYVVTAYIQSPQHMMPHLWRQPQWLAWFCYPILAGLALSRRGLSWSSPRARLVALIGVNLLGLALAWVAVEVLQDLRATVFQPFRMATVARGLCLVALADRVGRLWRSEHWTGPIRAALLVVGLSGDWSLVVATVTELAFTLGDRLSKRWGWVVGLAVWGFGLDYLARHDVDYGQIRLIAAALVAIVAARLWRSREWTFHRWRLARLVFLGWIVPATAFISPIIAGNPSPGWVEAVTARCRFGMWPTDDLERLALWCRDHTPKDARFIGPPGPKTFRLWSQRSLAFNRAGSPYHAEGLADWSARFRDHVGFEGSLSDFALAYLDDRQGLERRYDSLDLAALARRQGAGFVLASAPKAGEPEPDGLKLLKVEGRYAVYRLRKAPP